MDFAKMPTSPLSWSFQAIKFSSFFGGSDVGCCKSEKSVGTTCPKAEGCGFYAPSPKCWLWRVGDLEPAGIRTERHALFRLCGYAGNLISSYRDRGRSGC